MSINVTLYGSTRQVPETDEVDWGAEMTSLEVDSTRGVEATSERLDAGTKYALALGDVVTETFAAAGQISPKAGRHKVASTGGVVTLDPATAIADGTKEGQMLTLEGTSDADTIKIPATANVLLNGPWISSDGAVLTVYWDTARSVWVEMSRNN